MSVYRDRRVSVPACKGITRCSNLGKVLYRLPAGYSNSNITTATPCIGYLCEDNPTLMYPNDTYKLLFASDWEKQFGDRPIPAIKKIGMYAAVKEIDRLTTVKTLLNQSFGEPKANSLIDFAMYSILYKTNVADHFCADMKDYLLYSDTPFSDAYYSDLFKKGMPWEEIATFNIGWVKWCKDNGVEEVYICIDGSNEDCDAKGVEFAEGGHSKSKKNKKIVGFTYAVTEKGMPVAYKVYRGGLIDAKAMKKILNFFNELGLKVKGVIIDRGYCFTDVFDYLREQKISYVVMVRGKPEGFASMYEDQENMKHNGEAFIFGTELYAVQRSVRLYKKSAYEDYLTIFFDQKNASGQESALMAKINKEAARVNRLLSKGKEEVVIKKDLDSLLYIDEKQQPDGTVVKEVKLNSIEYNEAISEKGLYSILTSEALPIAEVDRLYNCRDASEKTYSILKTQLGYGTMHIHCTLGTQSKYCLAFISSIIRYFIEINARPLGRSTNQMVDELKTIQLERYNKQYYYDDADKALTKAFFKKLGSAEDLLPQIAKETNNRVLGIALKPRQKKRGPKKKTHHVVLDVNGNVLKKKPGPKPGSIRGDINKDGTPRKKPGPKPGFTRGEFNADGSKRQKPGPKPKLTH